MTQFIGRRVSVGLGLESTPGTEVAAATWARHLSLTFQRKTETIDNESALGRVEASDDSAIVKQWAEGTLEGKVCDSTIGYVLYNVLGSLSTGDNADSDASVKDHTFTVNQSNVAKTLTVYRKDPVSDRRHGFGTIERLEISWEAGEWVKFTADIKAENGATTTSTVSYAAENEFTSKHVTVKLASAVAGLGAASALTTKSGKITIERPANVFFASGSVDLSSITTGSLKVMGELVLQYEDSTYEDFWAGNTARAMSISLVNTDVTIGSSANPGLVVTMPKVRLNTFDMSDDLDEIIEQTVGFKGELSVSDAYMIQAVLTNTTASY